MEILLLLGLGAYLLSQQNAGGSNGGGGSSNSGGGGGGGGDLPPAPVITTELILPHVKVGGKDVVVAQLPLPSGSFNKAVVCNRPGGEARVADLQKKYNNYLRAYIRWSNLPRAFRIAPGNLLIINNFKKRYQNALQFHLAQCN